MRDHYDIVIVGGGIAGSALGAVLARQGVRVKILERETVYPDRVRGEFMACWGVTELTRLGLRDVLTAAGALAPRRFIPYDENLPPEGGEARALTVAQLGPGLPDPICMGHPDMCEALNRAAVEAGASVSRGVGSISVETGERPKITCKIDEAEVTFRPRLVIGADGRNSLVRRQIGAELLKDPPHNLLGGILVEGDTSWPMDAFTLGTEDRLHFLIFPQPQNRLRLYVCYDHADRARFAGPDRAENLIAAFNMKCLPQGEEISRCTPVSRFHSYSNEDHWVDAPVAPGVVLVGDAAGHCDPITGQGLSISLRDVRIVSDILAEGDWSAAAFAPYVEERRERMRRTRFTARYSARLRAEFGEEARERRARAVRRQDAEGYPSPANASLAGPDALPAECFEESAIDALFAP